MVMARRGWPLADGLTVPEGYTPNFGKGNLACCTPSTSICSVIVVRLQVLSGINLTTLKPWDFITCLVVFELQRPVLDHKNRIS